MTSYFLRFNIALNGQTITEAIPTGSGRGDVILDRATTF